MTLGFSCIALLFSSLCYLRFRAFYSSNFRHSSSFVCFAVYLLFMSLLSFKKIPLLLVSIAFLGLCLTAFVDFLLSNLLSTQYTCIPDPKNVSPSFVATMELDLSVEFLHERIDIAFDVQARKSFILPIA